MNNSFRIQFRGPRVDADKIVAKSAAVPANSDQTQCSAARSAITGLLKQLAPKLDGVNILSYGELGPTGGEFRVHVSGYMLAPDPEPEEAPSAQP